MFNTYVAYSCNHFSFVKRLFTKNESERVATLGMNLEVNSELMQGKATRKPDFVQLHVATKDFWLSQPSGS